MKSNKLKSNSSSCANFFLRVWGKKEKRTHRSWKNPMFTEATQCRVLMQHLGGGKKGKKNKSLYLLSIRQNVCLPGKQEFKMTNRSCTETQTKVNKDLFMCQVSAMSPKYIKWKSQWYFELTQSSKDETTCKFPFSETCVFTISNQI